MIDLEKRIIYIDHSELSAFQSCKYKGQLGYNKGYRLKKTKASLSFGHAFHAAVSAYYDALAGGWRDNNNRWQRFTESISPTKQAQLAFLHDLKIEGNELPVSLESDERRSIERGLALVEAYIARWKDEPYENLLDIQGAPYTEIGFEFPLMIWRAPDGTVFDVMIVGVIDRLMINLRNKRPVLWETKTTTKGLDQFIQQCKPNNQVTTYFTHVKDLFPDIRECIWDCVFVSSRKPDMSKALTDRFWMYGIDVIKDFKRQPTSRSTTDVELYIRDTTALATEYCHWLFSEAEEWPRDGIFSGACHLYDGCQFRDVCRVNGDQSFLNTYFEIKPWDPRKKIRTSNE